MFVSIHFMQNNLHDKALTERERERVEPCQILMRSQEIGHL